jgi:hypothetical protein
MRRYDPIKAPTPEEWLALDEQERIILAEDYHRRARIRLPNATLHATMHAVVENQIALGDETRRGALCGASGTRASPAIRRSTPSARCSSNTSMTC